MTYYIIETFKWVGLIGFLLAVTYAPAFGLYLLWDSRDNLAIGAAAWVVAIIVTVGWCGVVVWALSLDDNRPGVHSWKGGSGAETRCYYEDRDHTVLVGKVPVTNTDVYTVCVDASGEGR